jgi:hypothetical protein
MSAPSPDGSRTWSPVGASGVGADLRLKHGGAGCAAKTDLRIPQVWVSTTNWSARVEPART